LMRESTDDIAVVVASGPSDAGAHDTGITRAIGAAEAELQTPGASAPAMTNARIVRKLDMSCRVRQSNTIP
jgi:hypothetical protein